MKALSTMITVIALCSAMAAAEPGPTVDGTLGPVVPAHPSPSAGLASAATKTISGKVLETMNAAGYTYVRIASSDGGMWAAGPQTAVSVGDTVTFSRGMAMKNFHSDKLDRTFDSIAFVSAITVGAPSPASGLPKPGTANPYGAFAGAGAQGVDVADVARAEGGKTVAEVFEQKDALAGKEVILRAKVVKVNRGIMGRNWLHLRDGTHASTGADDLTVTSSGVAEVGATVVVRGKVALNKDFGFGYRYEVMLEEATIDPE